MSYAAITTAISLRTRIKTLNLPFWSPQTLANNMTICGLYLHHENTESQRKTFEQGFLLSTQNQWMPHIPLIYSQIHVTIFPPMARLLLTLIKSNSTNNSCIRSDEKLALEISTLWIFHGGSSTFINSFDKFLLQSSTDQTPQVYLETRNLLTTFAI